MQQIVQFEYVTDVSEKSANEQTVNVNEAPSINEETLQEKTVKVIFSCFFRNIDQIK